MSNSSAARTNLSSNQVRIGSRIIGEGVFRTCLEGTFIGGNRNQQAAVCKRFKRHFRAMEDDFFAKDFKIVDQCIFIAEQWNAQCEYDKTILITKGAIHFSNSGIQYLVEPFIRDFEKFTSNNGWIGDQGVWEVLCMEALSHFSYHISGGQLIVCDIQGRYRHNRFARSKSRFELTDPAICSRSRQFGPTDLGDKGIASFFANHSCNGFCDAHWSKPVNRQTWFPRSQGTSMLSSRYNQDLKISSRTNFRLGVNNILEEDSDYSDDDYY